MKERVQVMMKGGAQVMKRALGIFLTVLLMGGAEGLVAQRPGGSSQRAEMELRIQARFDNLVREELELSDDQTRQLQEAVEDFRSRRLEFSRSELNTRARVGRLGAAGGEITRIQGLIAEEKQARKDALSPDNRGLVRREQQRMLSS